MFAVASTPDRGYRSLQTESKLSTTPILKRSTRPNTTSSSLHQLTRRRVIRKASNAVMIGIGAATVLTAATAAVAMAASASSNDPQTLVRSGMAKFVKGDVEGSVEDFDAALAAKPTIRPYLWQRGLSLYYLKQYQEGATQFRDDVAVNPNDTEESIWAFLCEAQLVGPEKARENFLKVGRDSRPVMRAAYEAFQNGTGTEGILSAAGGERGVKIGNHAAFYALLYVGLYNEAEGEEEKAKQAMVQAVKTQYGQSSGDYMADLARVHCERRGWL